MANAKSDLTFRIFGKDVTASKALRGVGQQAGKTSKGLGGVVAGFGGMAGIATAAAAGAAAVGYALFDAGKAAASDEAEQRKLAKTLQNVTGATDSTIAATEDYIDQMARATGVADSELRPAMETLVRATGDVEKSQALLTTAMDVAAGTGKPLKTVVLALSKAYNGSTGSLGRLGLNMKDADGKALSFEAAMARLNTQFSGQAAEKADTYDGKMARLGVAFDELKESVGAQVLPVLETFSDWMIETGLPALEDFQKFIEEDVAPVLRAYFQPAIDGITAAFQDMGKTVEENRDFFDDLMAVAKPLAAFAGGQMALSLKVVAGVFRAVTAAASFARDIYLKVSGAMGELIRKAKPFTDAFGKAAGVIKSVFTGAFEAISSAWNSTLGGRGFTVPEWLKYLPGGGAFAGRSWTIPMLADGGIVTRPTLAMIGEAGPEAVVPLSRGGYGGTTVNVYVSGDTDPAGAARRIGALLDQGIASGAWRPNRLATR